MAIHVKTMLHVNLERTDRYVNQRLVSHWKTERFSRCIVQRIVECLYHIIDTVWIWLYIYYMIVREIWRFIPPGKYDFSRENESSYLLNYVHAINCFLYQMSGDNFYTSGFNRFSVIAKQWCNGLNWFLSVSFLI